ncbi:MAG: glycosyl hydrolase 115 family protein [Clostridium sp.]|uniref:glycosyl hydrolase 115 family protein n=1 Tax=Clostridium sp. TaxID=1506 RepID=UPI0029151F4A|nr:glycosyl hydrolase 115 family protein [Clostridium sp.]MDU5109912.1 glycosyl hydrolase 115 family protein [Clostridium sp.]
MLGINRNTTIISEIHEKPVQWAIKALKRDIYKACIETENEGMAIYLIKGKQEKECFQLNCNENKLELQASDEMGFIYGIYEISCRILGITPFWFWNDQEIIPKEDYTVPEGYNYHSESFKVKYRGWFVNDEVLIHTWSVNRRREEPWEMVFESLLRLGGNMAIPGTDRNSEIYRKLASDMGLTITHHHAEPLGADMFARVFPDLNPSYEEHSEKFQQLWREGIESQKNMKVIWNLGFRGQGDCPFWDNDPRYQTNKARGELMSKLIKIQYDMVKEVIPNAVCSTNLYGETMELYREGCLKLPNDIIKIWADNGFGKMVSRRQENHNPRIYALPDKGDNGSHGIYYHVSFYDLQAANHITMLPNPPEFVQKELDDVLQHSVDDFWIVNCSNVKPHVYFLDFISEIWKNGCVNVEEHRKRYVSQYYGYKHADEVINRLKEYHDYSLAYGENEDEHSGEQFSNHVARILISQYMKNKQERAEELLWATDGVTLKDQVEWYQKLCHKAKCGYLEYMKKCEKTAISLEEKEESLFRDSILLQSKIHYHCFLGAYEACKSILKAMERDYQSAFYFAGKARKEYLNADKAMRNCEHGKWHNFYANECLADVKQTAWVLASLMGYLRNLGDGPHFYKWQRDFLYSEEDRRVMLIMNMENHLKDEELFSLMEEKWS